MDELRPPKCRIDLGDLRGEGICVRRTPGDDSLEILIGTDESSGSGGDFRLAHVKVGHVMELLEKENEIKNIEVVASC